MTAARFLPWAACAALVLCGSACQVLGDGPRDPVVPVPAAASRAFAQARLLLAGAPAAGPGVSGERPQDPGRDAWDRARGLALRARDLAPDWVAPRRFLDDLARADLTGPQALAAHLTVIREHPADALHLYLAGRLEGTGEAAEGHLRAAATADGDLAWAQHGLAWLARRGGRWDAAEMYARRALERARDPHERALFSEMIARALAGGGELGGALDILARALDGGEAPEPERSSMAVLAVQLAASGPEAVDRDRAWERGIDLLSAGDLVPAQLAALARTLAELGGRLAAGRAEDTAPGAGDRARELRVGLAVGRARASRDGALVGTGASDALLAELLLADGPTPLALDLLEGSGGRAPAVLLRAARFAAGRPAQAMAGWLGDLPRQVLAGAGQPLDPRLAELARLTAGQPAPVATLELGTACLAAGWFDEARAVAGLAGGGGGGEGARPAVALAEARLLDSAAEAGRLALANMRRALRRMDGQGEKARPPEAVAAGDGGAQRAAGRIDLEAMLEAGELGESGHAGDDGGLGELLRRLAPPLAVWRTLRTGQAVDVEVLQEELGRSPRVSFSGIGEMIHCGPLYSARDEVAGRGEAGTPVPGLAAVFASMGRFGLFGTHTMDAVPDGVVLPVVLAEYRQGSHLGTPWSGTVVWCEGADLAPRAARKGVRITGSALHEGFWVDIEAVRGERDGWDRLARRFSGPTGHARLRRALATRGLDLSHLPSGEIRRRRIAEQPLLGEGERVRLAVLADRHGPMDQNPGTDGPGDGAHCGGIPFELVGPSLTELVATTARHEEGHLCDQARFLPLSEHKGRVLALFMRCGFSPAAVLRRLEYRAQLTALCVDADPRLALAQILRAVDRSGLVRSVLPHGEAYEDLLADLVDELDGNLQRDPGAWPEIHPTRTLVHQLHHLSSDQVRDLARALARDEGLIGA